MQVRKKSTTIILSLMLFIGLTSCGGGSTDKVPDAPVTPDTYDLAIVFGDTNTGTGSVTLSPSDIVCTVDCTEPFKAGTTVTLADAADLGSSFKGYGGDEDCLDLEVTMNADITCKPLFEINPSAVKYTLTITLAGLGMVMSDPAGIDCGAVCEKAYFDSSTVTLTATPASGNKFVSWSGDCSSDTIVMTADVNCIATFEPINTDVDLTIDFTGGGSGTVTSSIPTGTVCNNAPCVTPYAVDSIVTLTAIPAANNDFANWSGGCTSINANPETIVTLDAAKTCTAAFELKPVVVPNNLAINLIGSAVDKGLVTSSPSGINCGTTCTKDFAPDTVVTLTATPVDATATFTGWGSSCSGSATTTTVTMDIAKDCTATFDIVPVIVTYELTVVKVGSGIITSAPTGINCGATCNQSYDANTVVELTATQATGYNFDSWTGACVGASNITSVTMTAAKTCTATFNLIPVTTYNLTLMIAGTGDGTVTPTPIGIPCGAGCWTYNSGDSVTITALATYGDFRNWSSGCTTGIILISSNVTCVAIFEAISYSATPATPATPFSIVNSGTGAGIIEVSAVSGGSSCTIPSGTSCNFVFVIGETLTIVVTPDAFSYLVSDCLGGTSRVTSTVSAGNNNCTMVFNRRP